MVVFNIPRDITPVRSLNTAKYILNCDYSEEYYYDFSRMQNCHPFGLLVIASAIRKNRKRFPRSSHTAIGANDSQGGRFAATLGFFQSVGFDIGLYREESEIGYYYIPIKRITAKQLHDTYQDTIVLNEKVDLHAAALADTIVSGSPVQVRKAIQYCLREIMRNTFEHAKTDCLWVCGQYWPSRNEAEIAILDEGIGILRSLQSNSLIKVSTCQQANSLALQPGLTSKLGLKQDDDFWHNSGYGLYVASTLCAISSGYFLLSSGDSAILINNQNHIQKQVEYEANQIGTAICLNLRPTNPNLRNFQKTLDAIVAEGEEKAKENGQQRIISASKVTTIASMIGHIERSVRSVPTTSTTSVVPLNTEVEFHVQRANAQGELIGFFNYKDVDYSGRLLNISKFNREKYVSINAIIPAVVRKYKGEYYNLFERHAVNI